MRKPKVITTTLGDLIVAVTDEVKLFIRDPAGVYKAVSLVLNDILARHQMRVQRRARRNGASFNMVRSSKPRSIAVS